MSRQLSSSDFKIGKEIGSGSFGVVHKATRKRDNKTVAIKISKEPLNATQRQELMREINIIQKINSPYVIKYFGSYFVRNKAHIVTEYVEGQELFYAITSNVFQTMVEKVHVICQLLYGLKDIHDADVTHHDIKCENIMLTNDLKIKYIDFGLSCELNNMKDCPMIAGTPHYVPPEIWLKNVNDLESLKRADVWSLGVVIYSLDTRIPAFNSDNDNIRELKGLIISDEPVWKEVGNKKLRAMVRLMLEKDPQERTNIDETIEIFDCFWATF